MDQRLLEEIKANFAAQFVEEFCYLHGQNIEGANFKIGDTVEVWKHEGVERKAVHTGVVIAVSQQDDDVFEYAVSGYPWLLWETDLVLKEAHHG